jgi:hypothetical protein
MWAQYADAHRGCCLIFDRDQLLASAIEVIANVRFGLVEYIAGFDPALHKAETADFNQPIRRVAGSDPAAQHERILGSLFRKNGDWQAEREYGIVADSWIAQEACRIPIGECAVGIAFGQALAPHHLPIVEALRERFGLSGLDPALMTIDSGVLVAYPMIAPDGRAVDGPIAISARTSPSSTTRSAGEGRRPAPGTCA